MQFKKLGTTDIDVSLICLGTMTWGEQNTKEDAFEQMNYAVLIQQNYMLFHLKKRLTVEQNHI